MTWKRSPLENYTPQRLFNMLVPQRTGHRMKPNDASYLPGRIIAFDTETRPQVSAANNASRDHNFRLGHIISGHYRRGKFSNRQSLAFTDPLSLWNYIDSQSGRRNTLWVVAHSALFDLVVCGLREHFESGRYSLDAPRSPRQKDENGNDQASERSLLALDGPPFIVCLRCNSTGGRIMFVDTLNWFRSSLSDIGTSLELPKLKFPEFSDDDEVWAEYCGRDAEICFQAFCNLIEWHRDNDLGVFRYTAASQAMGCYRHRFATTPIYFHDNAECKILERKGFFGGRTECYRIGGISEPVYQVDVNSLYPSVMRSSHYPYILDAFEGDDIPRDIPPAIDWSACVAEVDLIDPPPIYPFRADDITVYPRGSFRTTLCGPELQHAITSGHVATIGRYAVYKTAELFTPFVDFFWNLRSKYKAEGNTVYADLAKIILNSLFGKFAQRSYRWEECENRIGGLHLTQWSEWNSDRKAATMHRCIGGRVYRQVESGERSDTLIAISGFVASYGRMRMNTLRAIAGPANVFYQGVDSLLVNTAGKEALNVANCLSETELGGLKQNYAADNATIYNCADYKIGSREIVAGRPRNSELATNGKMVSRSFNAVASLFADGGGAAIQERIVEWQRKGEYRKGTKAAGGWIEPLIL